MSADKDAYLVVDALKSAEGLDLCEGSVDILVPDVLLDTSLCVSTAEEDAPVQVLVCFNYYEAIVKFKDIDEAPLSWSQILKAVLEIF